MAEILCIRHGQASFDSDDYDQLSKYGYQQGRLLGEYLLKSETRFDRIYAGTLKRQLQTAEAVRQVYLENSIQPPEIDTDARWNELQSEQQVAVIAPILQASNPAIAEYMNAARSDKKAFQKLIRATFDFWIEHSDQIPELESWAAAQARVREALTQVHKENGSGTTVGVFSSGGIIAIITALVLKLPASGVYPLFEKVINASITRLLHNNHSIALSSFNEHSYLQAIAKDASEAGIVTYR